MDRLISPSQPPAAPCFDPVPDFSDDECGECGEAKGCKGVEECWTCRNGAKFKFPTLGQNERKDINSFVQKG